VSRLRADRRVGLLLGGILLLTFVAIGATIALPASDKTLRTRDTNKMSAIDTRGMRVYQSEGCWYCHTTYDRNTKFEPGKALDPSGYAGRSPVMLGSDRFGPDLTHGAPTLSSKDDLVKYFRKAHGSMQSYDFLSQKDLDALAAYLLSLR
jgi:cbb3-type cytochrome oxidase cytochrome c subunit